MSQQKGETAHRVIYCESGFFSNFMFVSCEGEVCVCVAVN